MNERSGSRPRSRRKIFGRAASGGQQAAVRARLRAGGGEVFPLVAVALFIALLVPASVSAGPFASGAVAWTRTAVIGDSLDLGTIAIREAERDHLRSRLASELADLAADSAAVWPELEPEESRWVQNRVREGLLLADPRWSGFARSGSRFLPTADPGGTWTLPGSLYLHSRGQVGAALRWLRAGRVPPDDAPFLALLEVELIAASGDSTRAATAAALLLSRTGWPTWVQEPLEEVLILATLRSGRHEEAAARLGDYGRRFVRGPWYLGTEETLARRTGQRARADSLAWEIARTYPESARARRWLEARVPLGGPGPSDPPEQLRTLLQVAESQRGVTRFLGILDLLSPSLSPEQRGREELRAARLAYSTRRYEDLFDALRSGRIGPSDPLAAEWGLVLGRAYRNTGSPDSMAVWFDRAARRGNPDTRTTALWEWGREFESLRRFGEAAEIYERLLSLGAGEREEDAWIRLGFTRYQLGSYPGSEEAFARAARSSTAWRQATADFWRFRCRMALGDEAGARQALERAASASEGYYSARARSALRLEPALPASDILGYWRVLALIAEAPDLEEIRFRPDMADGPTEVVPPLTETAMVESERLWLFRQYSRASWAARALDALDGDPSLGGGRDRIARLQALRFPDLAARRALRTGPGEIELRFPAPYGAAVAAAAARGGLAPEWIWSIMRRESFFEATVTSPAGAIGLMQFMPDTAARVGERNGIPSEPLSSPVVNLALGIAHLRELVDETGGDWPQLLAGYNAGMHNAVRWVHPDEDPDVFIEMIGFRETRDYVKAVLEGFWIYRETLRPDHGSAP